MHNKTIIEINASNFYSLLIKYKVFVFDVAGTVIDGRVDINNAKAFLQYLLNENKRICFFSNSSGSAEDLLLRLSQVGITDKTKCSLYTSGQYFYESLISKQIKGFEKKLPKLFHLGKSKVPKILSHLEGFLYPFDECELVIVSESFESDLEFYTSFLDNILQKRLTLLCINPDIESPLKNKKYCPGIIAQYYKEKGGKVLYYGKPSKYAFKWLFNKENLKDKITKHDMIMIGDNIQTDILGANNFGIDSMLVLSGLTKSINEIIEKNKFYPTYFIQSLKI